MDELVERIAKVLAEHYPTYTDYATDPTMTFYCVPCSEGQGEWMTADPDHLARAVVEALGLREERGGDAGMDGYMYVREHRYATPWEDVEPYRWEQVTE